MNSINQQNQQIQRKISTNFTKINKISNKSKIFSKNLGIMTIVCWNSLKFRKINQNFIRWIRWRLFKSIFFVWFRFSNQRIQRNQYFFRPLIMTHVLRRILSVLFRYSSIFYNFSMTHSLWLFLEKRSNRAFTLQTIDYDSFTKPFTFRFSTV